MYIIHIVGMVLCVGKEFYVIQILELFYVEIIIFPVIFDGQTPPDSRCFWTQDIQNCRDF